MENLKINKNLEELDNKLEKLFYSKFPSESGNKTLYHYTKLDTLEKILSSGTFRLYDAFTMNDPNEIYYAKKVFYNLIEKDNTLIKNSKILEEVKKLENNFIKFCGLYENLPSAVLNQPMEKKSYYNYFILSACENPDYLPLWRYYGDNAKGVSIGFKNGIKKIEEIDYKQQYFQITRVLYEKEYLESYFKEWFAEIDNYSKLNNKENYATIMSTIMTYITGTFHFNKHPDFESENEFRLVYTFDTNNHKEFEKNIKLDYDYKPNCNKFNFPELLKQNEVKQRYFYEHKFEKDFIEKIYVGPLLRFDETEQKIKNWLYEYGYDFSKIEIVKSRKAFR
ncbi:MAG: DUF2971 domain-containing protein [Rickettsiales bacterium]|nr:DUF2971 domain-containing protein [Rickettsiales bacterium]